MCTGGKPRNALAWLILEDGRVQASGAVQELFSRLDLALAYEPDTETVIDLQLPNVMTTSASTMSIFRVDDLR